MDFLSTTPELNYMTQINIMMFEDPSKVMELLHSSILEYSCRRALFHGWMFILGLACVSIYIYIFSNFH